MRKPRASVRTLRAKKKLCENPGILFEDVLSEEEVDEHCRALGYTWRERIFTPLVTLWAFLSQVLSADGSCRDAVARVLGFLWKTKGLTASHDPSSYCEARRRLPHELMPNLTRLVAGKLRDKVPDEFLWHGRRVRLVDGSSVQMPDTPENQAKFPQPSAQARGCGFPVVRLTALFDLVSGAVLDLALGALSKAETTLFREIWPALESGDIVIGDRLFCSYADIVLLKNRGVDCIFRLHVKRKVNWREGRPLGRNDRLITWQKGPRPDWLSPEEFAGLPDELTLRLVRFRCTVPGFRADEIIVVTTLLDEKEYPAPEIAELYDRRWDVETDLGHLKTTMKMDLLRTRTPDMVYRELWAYMLAYNLIRTLMWDAADRKRLQPLRLSFKGTIQEMRALWPHSSARAGKDMTAFYEALLRAITYHKVPLRPGRTEPRLRKRRPKNYSLLGAPRHECRRQS